MGDVLLAPAILISNVGDYSVVGTGSTLTALSDGSDGTYVQGGDNFPLSSSGTGFWGKYVMADHHPSIPAGAIVDKVRAEMRLLRASLLEEMAVSDIGAINYPSLVSAGLFTTQERPGTTTGGGILDWIGPWRTQDSKGFWFHDLVASSGRLFQMWVRQRVNPAVYPYPGSARVHKVSLRVSYNERPVASVVGPTGVQITASPLIDWDYSDPEADPQEAYQIKVFSAAQYGAGGFDPEISTPVTDSGKIYSNTTSYMLPGALPNATTYRAYVKVWQPNVAGRAHSSLWAFSGFSVALDAPAIPFFTATPDPANGRILLDLQARDNELSQNAASFETNTTGWTALGTTTLTRQTAQFVNGTASLRMERTGTTGLAAAFSGFLAVAPSKTYTALASFRAVSTARDCSVTITWYTAALAQISAVASIPVTNSAGAWVQGSFSAVSPVNAAFAVVTVSMANAIATEQHYVDAISLAPGISTVWTRGGLVTAGQYLTLERSLDGGTTWEEMRGSPFVDPAVGQEILTGDYELPFGVNADYRVRTTVVDSLLNVVTGDWAATVTAGLSLTDARWWLKDLTDSSQNLIILPQPGFEATYPKPNQTGFPVGTDKATMSHDGVKGAIWSGGLWLLDKTSYDKFFALYRSGRTLLLQDVLGRQWFVQMDEVREVPMRATPINGEISRIRHAFEIQTTLIEVDYFG